MLFLLFSIGDSSIPDISFTSFGGRIIFGGPEGGVKEGGGGIPAPGNAGIFFGAVGGGAKNYPIGGGGGGGGIPVGGGGTLTEGIEGGGGIPAPDVDDAEGGPGGGGMLALVY